MAVEHGDRFLSESWQMRDAFEGMNSAYPELRQENPELISIHVFKLATYHYTMAGFSWLANRSNDPYLEERGTTAWWAAQQGVVEINSANDIRKAASARLKLKKGETLSFDMRWPQLVTQPFEGDFIQKGGVVVFLPFNMIGQAQRDPMRTVAKIAALASQISDFVNDRYHYPDEVLQRKVATYAHVLGRVSRLYPNFELNLSEQELLKDFPDGIDSLPPYMVQKGMNGNQIPNYWRN